MVPEENRVLRFFTRRMRTTTRFDGQKLFTYEDGKRVATPLFVTLLLVETTDIVFAIDSIPAIFAITRDPFIVLTSNVFAILGLRALYFLLADMMQRFHLLRYGLGIILAFVGIKMLLTAVPCHAETLFCHNEHVAIPIWLSLAFIVSVLAGTVILSLKITPKEVDPKTAVERETPPPELASDEEAENGTSSSAAGVPGSREAGPPP